jgi:alkylation response protein AidB-like acyl-CoA dehydrogenase
MNFEACDDDKALVAAFRRFAEDKVRPLARRQGDVAFSADQAKALFKLLAPQGFGVANVPQADGGLGLANVTVGLLLEELARVDGGIAGLASIHDGSNGLIARQAPPQVKEKYLKRLIAGDLTLCVGITEPGVGSNPREVRTRAVRDGDMLRVTGAKTWVSNAHVSDLCVAICRTDDFGAGSLSMVLIDRAESGYRSANLHKIGLNNWPTGELVFDDVAVPVGNIIGAPGRGLVQTMQAFERARCFVGIISLGIAQAAFEHAVAYAKTREQWGKPIAAHQSIQIKIAEMAVDLDAARLLVYRGLSLLDAGQRCDTQTSMAKWYATEMGVRVTHRAMEIFGAYGLSPEYPVEQLFRNARVMPVPDGTSDIQRLVIGRNITGISAF